MLVLWWAACGGGGNGDGKDLTGGQDDCPSDLSVSLGSGSPPVVPADDGVDLQMVHGDQGGWHVYVSGLVVMPTEQVSISATVQVDGAQIAGEQSPFYTALADYDPETCEGQFYEVYAYIDDEFSSLPTGTNVLTDYICLLGGKLATISVEIEDLDSGDIVTDELEGVLILDPYDVSLCAQDE